jgi:hypothetical protein
LLYLPIAFGMSYITITKAPHQAGNGAQKYVNLLSAQNIDLKFEIMIMAS